MLDAEPVDEMLLEPADVITVRDPSRPHDFTDRSILGGAEVQGGPAEPVCAPHVRPREQRPEPVEDRSLGHTGNPR